MRILLYAQHLSGVGHYVRTHVIACHLAAHHDVLLVEGGRPVPRRPGPANLKVLELPRIVRGGGGLKILGAPSPARQLTDIMALRARILAQTLADFRPEVLLIEHYPFSKWELQSEIEDAIAAARSHNPSVKIDCSLRDVVFQTRHEAVPEWEYRAQVIETLNEHFDLIIVHSDERFLRIEDSFGAVNGIRPPIRYSGMVSEPIASVGAQIPTAASSQPHAILSIGGGSGHAPLVDCCVEAWKTLSGNGALGNRKLLLYAGLAWEPDRIRRLQSLGGDAVEVRPFSPDYLSFLKSADLAICHAGYNTCANVLETGVRALLVPDPQMSDQRLRAVRLAELGAVQFMEMESVTRDSMAERILQTLNFQPKPHHISLDGAEQTRRILEDRREVAG